MPGQDFEILVDTAVSALRNQQDQLSRDYGPGRLARWWFDQQTATVQFFDEDERLVGEADVLNVGSLAPKRRNWMWAWNNPALLTAP